MNTSEENFSKWQAGVGRGNIWMRKRERTSFKTESEGVGRMCAGEEFWKRSSREMKDSSQATALWRNI